MLLYTHAVWSFDLTGFFGPHGFLPPKLVQEIHSGMPDSPGAPIDTSHAPWSHFYYVQTPTLMWTIHIVALVVFFLLMLGLFSRTMALVGFLFAVSYADRVSPGAFLASIKSIRCLPCI